VVPDAASAADRERRAGDQNDRDDGEHCKDQSSAHRAPFRRLATTVEDGSETAVRGRDRPLISLSSRSGNIPAMRVLVVEDETRMAALIRRGLVEEGHAADVAAAGE